MRRSACLSVIVAIVSGLGSTASAAETLAEIVTLTNERVAGTIRAWTPDRITLSADVPRDVATTDLVSIRFPKHPRRLSVGPCVVLINGDRFAVTPGRTRDEQLSATWTQAPLRPEAVFPLEHVAAVLFTTTPGHVEALGTLAEFGRIRSGHDTVRLVAGDRLTGEFEQLDLGFLEIAAPVGPLKLDRSGVQWLALDPDLAAPLPVKPDRWIAFLTDGSRITATQCVPRPDLTVELVPLVGGKVTVPWHEIARLQRITPRIVPLSERKPVDVQYVPYLSGQQALMRDRSAVGSPLMMRGEEFATGLGMRSLMRVTYAVEPGDQWFFSQTGLDDAARGLGSCRFRIELDESEVWASGEMTGLSEPLRTPRIDVQSRQRLTLVVDFGDRGDVGDLADWADATLLRGP